MKFYYDNTNGYKFDGSEPDLNLTQTIPLVPWSQELEDKLKKACAAEDWENPLMNLMPVYTIHLQLSDQFAEVESEDEARQLICNEWSTIYFEHIHDL